ncbi:MAG TPA: hypothetical protein VJ792_02805 [Candidatus Nitrosotalea sp.]|nr:hypothetical protein [Candidatus Nitrosotalea sp.]
MAVDSARNLVYVTNQGDGTISVINGSTNTVNSTIHIGGAPGLLSFVPPNLLYIANDHSNTVDVVNSSTNTVIANVTVGSSPFKPVYNPQNNQVYVPNIYSNTVTVINVATNTVATTITVGSGPTGIIINPNTNTIYVTNLFAGTVSIINGSSNSIIATFPLPGTSSGVANPNKNIIYFADFLSNFVYVVNGSTNKIITNVTVGNGPAEPAYNPTKNQIFVNNLQSNTVSIINASNNAVTAVVPVGNQPYGNSVNTITNTDYVANQNSNTVSVITYTTNSPPTANAGPNQFVIGGTVVTLNGTKSNDIDGDPLTFSWSQISGPHVTLSNSTIPTPTFTAPQVDAITPLQFQLTVNDGFFISSATVTIEVSPPTSFTIPMNGGNGQLTGSVNIGNLTNGINIKLQYVNQPGILSFGQLKQTAIPVGVNGTNVSLSALESSRLPPNTPAGPVNASLFFELNTTGIDFANPASFSSNQSPATEFYVNHNFTSTNLYPDNCPVVPLYLLGSNNQWSQFGNPLVPDTNMIYADSSSSNILKVIDGSTNKIVANVTVGNSPNDIVFNPNTNLLYVANSGSNNVSVIDTSSNTVVTTIPVGNGPHLMDVNVATNKIYVANSGGGTVSVIDGSTNVVIATINVGGSNLTGIGVNVHNNKIYVTDFFTKRLFVVDGLTNTVQNTITLPDNPTQVVYDANLNHLFVGQYLTGSVTVLDASTNAIITTVPSGSGPALLTLNPNTDQIYVPSQGSGTVTDIDGITNTVIASIPTGNAPFQVVVNPNTNRIYASDPVSSKVSVIDGYSNSVIATIQVPGGAQGLGINPNVSNPVRDPSDDIKDNAGNILQCAYIAHHPHLSKFAVGGVIIQPALALLGIGGSSGGTTTPPSMTVSSLTSGNSLPDDIKNLMAHENSFTPLSPINDPSLDLPLTINGNGFPITGSASTIQTQSFQTGQPIHLKLVFHSPYDVEHVSLFTNLRGSSRDIQDSDTTITYENGQNPQILDPHGYFSDVKVAKSTNGDRIEFDYEITFAKPMDTSDIILRSWNTYKASQDTDIMNTWNVKEQSQISPSQLPTQSAQNQAGSSISVPQNQEPQQVDMMNAIKEWGGYSPTSISDSQFLSDLGIKAQHIPSWVMKTSEWVVKGGESQDEFVNDIKYLHDKGVIR